MAHRRRGWFRVLNVTVILNRNPTFSNRGAGPKRVARIDATAASRAVCWRRHCERAKASRSIYVAPVQNSKRAIGDSGGASFQETLQTATGLSHA